MPVRRPDSRRRRQLSTALGRVLAVLAVTVLVFAAASGITGVSAKYTTAEAAPSAFVCTTPTIFDSNGTPNTVLDAQFQSASGSSFTPVGPASGGVYNAIGYNTANNLIYGIGSGGAYPNGSLVLIDSTGAVTVLGAVTGFKAADTSFLAGAFDAANNFYVLGNQTGTLYQVNLTTRVATAMTLSQTVSAFDITYAGGFFWGIQNSSSTLARIDPTTGTVTLFSLASIGVPAGQYGAAWTYGNGNLGFDINTGGVYQISLVNPSGTPTFALVSKSAGPASSVNDGTSCVPGPVDLGISKTGPAVVAPSGTVTWTLTVHNYGPNVSSGFNVSDPVPAGYTNVTSTTAGCTVTAGTLKCLGGTLAIGADYVITLTGTAPVAVGCYTNTASVLGNEADPNSANNTASAQTCVAGYTIAKSATAPSSSGVVTYTVTVTNTGGAAYTAALPASFSDNLSDVLDDATYVAGSATSNVAGWTFTGPSGSPATLTGSGPLAVSQTATITYQVKINSPDLGNGKLINVVTPTGPGGGCSPNAAACTTTTPVPTSAQVNKTWTITDPAGHVVGTYNLPSLATDTGPTLPAGFSASPTLTGQAAPAFGTPYGGFIVGQTVTVGESAVGVPTGCVLKTSQLTGVNGTALANPAALPFTGTLTPNLTTFTITNTVTCTQSLTLVKMVDFGSLPASSWTLTGTGPTGALTGPNGATGTAAATANITPAAPYALGESSTATGAQNYIPTSAGWACTDNANGTAVAVSASQVTARYGQSLTCTIHNISAKVTLLKHVQSPTGGLTSGQFNLTLTPPSGLGAAATFAGSETASTTNTFEVKPGSSYALTEQSLSSSVAYLALGLQMSTDAGATWTNVPSGQITPTAGQQVYYRLVNQPVPAIVLPLTGGIGTDVISRWGIGLLASAAGLAGWQLFRTRRTRRP